MIPLLAPSIIASAPPTPWAPLVEPEPILVGRPYQRRIPFEPEPDVIPGPPPSAYRPPQPPRLATPFTTAAVASAPSWPANSPNGGNAQAATPAETEDVKPSSTPFVDTARFVEIAGWFVIVGAAMSVLGFLLPWSRTVIGAAGIGGYFDGWGLASPTHVVVVIGLLAILALGILRTPLPAWIWSAVLSLVLGGMLIGLAWPYLVGRLGADVGVMVITLGGLAMLIGGVVTAWATRHGTMDPLV